MVIGHSLEAPPPWIYGVSPGSIANAAIFTTTAPSAEKREIADSLRTIAMMGKVLTRQELEASWAQLSEDQRRKVIQCSLMTGYEGRGSYETVVDFGNVLLFGDGEIWVTLR